MTKKMEEAKTSKTSKRQKDAKSSKKDLLDNPFISLTTGNEQKSGNKRVPGQKTKFGKYHMGSEIKF